MRKIFALTSLILLTVTALAQTGMPYKQFGDIRAHFSAFNSNFLDPEIASAYDITRGEGKGIVNIAVVPEGAGAGRPAVVDGTVTNILAQQQSLEFFEIREGDAVYYLAPFNFEDEDPMTFKIQIQADENARSHSLTFQRTFYHDE